MTLHLPDSKLRFFALGLLVAAAFPPAMHADESPRLLRKAPFLKVPYPADYPPSLKETLSPGSVDLVLDVDERGRVSKVGIVSATHPDFIASTLAASRRWVFEPTVLEGRPQSVRFGFVAFFGVEDRFHREAGDHRFGFHLLPASTQAQSRAFDVLPSIVSAVNPVFPYEMAVAETRGRAEVVFDLDSTGRVEHMTVVSCDHPELAEALRAMGEACRFTGAFKDRKAIGYQLRRPQDFAPFAEFLSFDSRTKKLLELLRSGGGGIVAVGELDAKPAPIYRPGPVYPQALLAARTAGSAEIEFFIDPDGRAQLPRIVSASQPEFGWAAATAVQQWYYDPPRRQGKPAYVRVRIPMGFKPPPGSEAPRRAGS